MENRRLPIIQPKTLAEIDREFWEEIDSSKDEYLIYESRATVIEEVVGGYGANNHQAKSLNELDMQFIADVKKERALVPLAGNRMNDIFPDKVIFGEIAVAKKSGLSRRVWRSKIASFSLYLFLAFAVLFTLMTRSGGENSPPGNVFGFSFMRVLTHSMQSELPQGSMIITRRVDPTTLEVDNDISFFIDENTVVTHRIIYIYENYNNSGYPAFRTQGIESEHPDRNVVEHINIIGRVIYNSVFLGNASIFLGQHIIPIVICTVLLLMLFTTLKIAFTNDKNEDGAQESPSGEDIPCEFGT